MSEENWRWCWNCSSLVFGGRDPSGRSPGVCAYPAFGGGHDTARSGNYVLENTGPGQSGWRWCRKCAALWFSGNNVTTVCPAGDRHSVEGSPDYVLRTIDDPPQHGQEGWRWCRKCQGLHFAPTIGGRQCAAGGEHETRGSGAYVIEDLGGELVWLDALSGLHTILDPPRVSMWWDRRSSNNHVPRNNPWDPPGTNQPWAEGADADVWPRPATVGGRPAIRVGDDLGGHHKGFQLRTPDGASLGLWDTPYTLFAVVQRTSARGDNHVIGSEGLDCGAFGGFCTQNSALHLGWVGDRTVRFGQWANDVDLGDVPPFRSDRPVVSILAAYSDTATKCVSLDEPGFSSVAPPRNDGSLLLPGERSLFVGGAARWRPPEYHFNGFIFEILILSVRLDHGRFNRKRRLLREKYGLGAEPFHAA